VFARTCPFESGLGHQLAREFRRAPRAHLNYLPRRTTNANITWRKPLPGTANAIPAEMTVAGTDNRAIGRPSRPPPKTRKAALARLRAEVRLDCIRGLSLIASEFAGKLADLLQRLRGQELLAALATRTAAEQLLLVRIELASVLSQTGACHGADPGLRNNIGLESPSEVTTIRKCWSTWPSIRIRVY
jgi:hypothetical protein